jgi:hypothetical protein
LEQLRSDDVDRVGVESRLRHSGNAPWWKVRLVSIGLTVPWSDFVLAAFTLIVAGPNAGHYLAGWFGLSDVLIRVEARPVAADFAWRRAASRSCSITR